MLNRKSFLRQLTAVALTLPALAALTAAPAHANTAGTADEAKAMVKRAVAYIKDKGTDTAYAEFINGSSFKDRDLYVSIYDLKGNCLVHGANAKLVGKNLWDLKDQNGVEVIKMQTELALSKGEGWSQDFVFVNPVTKKLQTKVTYVQRVNDTWIGIGYYK